MTAPATKDDEPISDLVHTVKAELSRAKDELDRARLQVQTQRVQFQSGRDSLKALSEQLAETMRALGKLQSDLESERAGFEAEKETLEKLTLETQTALEKAVGSLELLAKDIAEARSELHSKTTTVREALERLSRSNLNLRNEIQSLSRVTQGSGLGCTVCPNCRRALVGQELFCDGCGVNLVRHSV